MDIIETRHQEITIFRLAGRLDSGSSPELDKQIVQTIENGFRNIILDCQKLDYITSAGLRVVVKTAKKLKPEAGRIVLCAMADYVKEVFEIAGFDSFLPILPTLEDGITLISSSSR
jgi:anti-sigma B factor antagonist